MSEEYYEILHWDGPSFYLDDPASDCDLEFKTWEDREAYMLYGTVPEYWNETFRAWIMKRIVERKEMVVGLSAIEKLLPSLHLIVEPIDEDGR